MRTNFWHTGSFRQAPCTSSISQVKLHCLTFSFQMSEWHSGEPFRECLLECWTKSQHLICVRVVKGVTWEWLSVLIWNFQDMMRGMISWPKKAVFARYYYCTTASVVTTTNAESIEVKIFRNVEGKVELNQNVLCACRLSKERMSNIFGTAFRTKLKIPGHREADVQLHKRQHFHWY